MIHTGAEGGTGGPEERGEDGAEPRFNQSQFINLSALTIVDGSGCASIFDRAAGSRRLRIGQANRGKGEDQTCAFS